jgi:hypothetical protein
MTDNRCTIPDLSGKGITRDRFTVGELRCLVVKSGPMGASCTCPRHDCRFAVSKRYTDGPRAGFAMTAHLRGIVRRHFRAEHPENLTDERDDWTD